MGPWGDSWVRVPRGRLPERDSIGRLIGNWYWLLPLPLPVVFREGYDYDIPSSFVVSGDRSLGAGSCCVAGSTKLPDKISAVLHCLTLEVGRDNMQAYRESVISTVSDKGEGPRRH